MRSLQGNEVEWLAMTRSSATGRLPATIELGLLSIVIGLVIALPVGIYSAIRQDSAADYAGRTVAIIGLQRLTSGWQLWS